MSKAADTGAATWCGAHPAISFCKRQVRATEKFVEVATRRSRSRYKYLRLIDSPPSSRVSFLASPLPAAAFALVAAGRRSSKIRPLIVHWEPRKVRISGYGTGSISRAVEAEATKEVDMMDTQ